MRVIAVLLLATLAAQASATFTCPVSGNMQTFWLGSDRRSLLTHVCDFISCHLLKTQSQAKWWMKEFLACVENKNKNVPPVEDIVDGNIFPRLYVGLCTLVPT